MDTLRQYQAQKIMVSMVSWCQENQPPISTVKTSIHREKVMLYIWWDHKGLIYYEQLKSDKNHYCGLLRTQIIAAEPRVERKTSRIRQKKRQNYFPCSRKH